MQSIPWDGQRISVPGLYSGIPLDDYHRGDICDGPSVSSSSLRTLWDKSPAHYWDQSPLNPNREERVETEAFTLGRAAHHLICGEPYFTKLFVVRPDRAPDGRDWSGNNLSCKAWLKQAQRDGKTVLKPDHVEIIKGMALSLSNNHLVQAGILNGLIERSMFWKDPETGVWLKARPDALPSDSGDYADLKTTQSVFYRDLQSTVGDYGYHQQGALVLDGAKALGLPVSSFSLVWIEKKRPYCARVQTLKDEDLARGGKQNRVALRTFHTCFINKTWPGPGDDRDDAEYVDLADWKRKQIDDRLNLQLGEAA